MRWRTLINRRSSLQIGSCRGIALHLHLSWFPLAAVVSYTLASQFLPELLPDRSPLTYAATGLVSSLLFFLSILLHELGHSIVSQRCGVPVTRITLYCIGGVAEIAREPDDPTSEIKIALGGPAVTVLITLLSLCLGLFLENRENDLPAVISYWLAAANFSLLIFNLIPAYPLDGGRVLRALLWKRTGRLARSTWISSRAALVLSAGLVLWGAYGLFAKHQWSALSFILIGWFLQRAARRGYQHSLEKELRSNGPAHHSNPGQSPESQPHSSDHTS